MIDEEDKTDIDKVDEKNRYADLENAGINSIYTMYRVLQLLLVISTVLCIVAGFILAVFLRNATPIPSNEYGSYQKTTVDNNHFAIIGFALLIFGPVCNAVIWAILKPFIVFLYDVKIIKNKLLQTTANQKSENENQ